MSVPPHVPGAPEGPQGQPSPYAPHGQQSPYPPHGQGPQGYAPPPGYYGAPPPPPKKKGKGKFIALGVVALIVIAIIASSIGGGGDETAGDSAPSSTSAADDAGAGENPDEAEADEAATVPKLGDVVVADDLEFTLTDFECGVTVEDYSGEVEPQGKFCTVHVSVKNVGKSATYLSSEHVKLLTEDGIEYSASDDTWLVDGVLLLEEINPGNTAKGDLYFDLPEDVELTKAMVGGGFLSAGKEIALI